MASTPDKIDTRRRTWWDGIRPYVERAPLASLALGISSAFALTMITSTLASRLAEAGIEKKSVTAFALVILAYNLKFLWAWVIEGVRLPVLGRLGQRVSWMIVLAACTMAAAINLGLADPRVSLAHTASTAILLGIAGASFDIVIDAYRIELLEPRQLGVGAGMGQYGWRIGSAGLGALARLESGQFRGGDHRVPRQSGQIGEPGENAVGVGVELSGGDWSGGVHEAAQPFEHLLV